MKKYYVVNKAYFKKKAKVRSLRYKAATQQYILSILKGGCVDCPEKDCRCLEFDHVRGKKYKNISVLLGREHSIATLKKELAKCVVRCANCHRKRTSDNQGWYKSIAPIRKSD